MLLNTLIVDKTFFLLLRSTLGKRILFVSLLSGFCAISGFHIIMTLSLGIEPGLHGWEESALTTAPSLLPVIYGRPITFTFAFRQ